LDDETWIQGISSGESIIAVQSTTTVCNFSMSAVVLDGHKLVFWGNGGNDILSGGYRAGSLQGGDGADLMWSDKADNAQSGGNGNDYSSSGVSSAHLAGSNNNDSLCALAPSNHVDAMEGGNGTDSACGTADFYSSVENNNTNCPAACALF
jgi:hypothetical protein